MSKLEKTGKSKDDPAIDKLAAEIKNYSIHSDLILEKTILKNMKRVLRLKEDLSIKGKKGKKN